MRNVLYCLVTALSTNLFAADSLHLACNGYIAQEVMDTSRALKRLTLRFSDFRSANGEDRDYKVGIVVNGKEYVGTTTSSGEPVDDIKLVSKERKADVMFDGILELLENRGLILKGKSHLESEQMEETYVIV